VAAVKRLARGDVGDLVERMERQIARAEAHVAAGDTLSHGNHVIVRDVGVIAGISLTMLGIKALKVLPSIPFAPGHKLVVLTPLYIVAALRTTTPLGSTLTGVTMGTVAFLLGDGRYGIFEILKHIAPGLVCDAAVPLMTRGDRRPGPVAWSLLGGLMGAGRFATIFVVTLLVQAPAIAWAILVPGLAVHTTFGVASGFVSYHIVSSVQKLRARVREASPEPESPPNAGEQVSTENEPS
jgi:hypothetical protein